MKVHGTSKRILYIYIYMHTYIHRYIHIYIFCMFGHFIQKYIFILIFWMLPSLVIVMCVTIIGNAAATPKTYYNIPDILCLDDMILCNA